MRKQRLLISLMLILAVGLPACGDDMMTMDGELADLSRHQAELEMDATMHHRDVLLASDTQGMRDLEETFAREGAGHLSAMEHRARDMESMCRMSGRSFQAGAMQETMGRVRARLQDHHDRMASSSDPAEMRAEEGAFRDVMLAMMAEMRQHQGAIRGSASGYSCRMHGH